MPLKLKTTDNCINWLSQKTHHDDAKRKHKYTTWNFTLQTSIKRYIYIQKRMDVSTTDKRYAPVRQLRRCSSERTPSNCRHKSQWATTRWRWVWKNWSWSKNNLSIISIRTPGTRSFYTGALHLLKCWQILDPDLNLHCVSWPFATKFVSVFVVLLR